MLTLIISFYLLGQWLYPRQLESGTCIGWFGYVIDQQHCLSSSTSSQNGLEIIGTPADWRHLWSKSYLDQHEGGNIPARCLLEIGSERDSAISKGEIRGHPFYGSRFTLRTWGSLYRQVYNEYHLNLSFLFTYNLIEFLLIRHRDDSNWYRGIIKVVIRNEVTVYYVDNGITNTIDVPPPRRSVGYFSGGHACEGSSLLFVQSKLASSCQSKLESRSSQTYAQINCWTWI